MKRRILVTGATSGIGRATALRLAEPGTEIIITGRRMERLEALKAEVEAKGAECVVLNFDVRSEAECIKHLEPLGRVDVLVNNAGLAAGLEHIDRGDSRDWDAMIDTNVKGLLYVTKIISRAMVDAGRGGHIINIGSIAGTEPYENGAVYCASKHVVEAQIEDILTLGADAYHFGNAIDLPRMSEKIPDDVVFMGNIDPVGIFCGDADAAYEATMDLLEKIGHRKNFVPSSGCDVPARANLEAADAFYRAVEEYYRD